jgi:carbon monoxide dehydrogenase subunit G
MEFTHEFRIPIDKDEALDVLTDLERVAPCMPGATLEEVDGDTYSGRVKVKVGPMSLTYAGDATVTEVDRENYTARIEAAGREKRGSGTASADVSASLTEDDEEGTIVTVVTDINITGKPAQFGRGALADVGGAIITRFADNLRDQLQEEQEEPEPEPEEAGAGAEEAAAATAGAAGGKRRVEARAPRDEALDILDVAGDTQAAKVVPIVAGVLLVLLIIWLLRRGDDEE